METKDCHFPTIQAAMNDYIESFDARSREGNNTPRTYRTALNKFGETLEKSGIDPSTSPLSELTEDAVEWFLADLHQEYATSTEHLYSGIVKEFFIHLESYGVIVNQARIQRIIKLNRRRLGERIVNYPFDEVEQVIDYADSLKTKQAEDDGERLRNLRDRALIIILAETGLRIHEALMLNRGDLDRREMMTVIIGKGDKQAVVRFSQRSLDAVDDYLKERQVIDGASNRPLHVLPVFARHDRKVGKKIKRISTRTGVNILKDRVTECLGIEFVGRITPHTLRHRFITVVYRETNSIKLAQELARHANMNMTQRYTHMADEEINRGYREIFDKK